MKIIAICGKAGSGKDYIASHYIIPYIKDILKGTFIQLSFADQLKVNVMTKYDISYKDLYEIKTQETRKLLQLEGTELGRNVHGQDIWINYYNNWIKVLKNRGMDYIITCDVRFQNEFRYLKSKNCVIIKLVAPERHHNRILKESNGNMDIYNQFKNHISECDLDNIPDNQFDAVINNDPGCVQNKLLDAILRSI
jgi:hypothetical protein